MRKNLVALALLLQPACASITGSSMDRLRVTASPKSAVVSVDDSVVGPAPLTVEVPKRRNSSVEVSAPGYQSASCSTQMSASGGYIAADVALCVIFFPLGCISFIDAGGAWNQLDSAHCHVTLQPDAAAPPVAAAHAR